MSKLRIAVLFGGPSSEREVSIVTGQAVVDNLDKNKYEIYPVEMTKDRIFVLCKGESNNICGLDWFKKNIDVVFIALHGSPGEDGGVQGLFESIGVKYTGSGVMASALAMNKLYASQIFLANGLPVPLFDHVKRVGWRKHHELAVKQILKKIGLPLVVKPIDQGSAVGVSIVKTEKDLTKIMNKTLKEFPWVMVQEFIDGHELTCGVLDIKGESVAVPPTLILPKKNAFYDYASKYANGGSDHICPAPFSKAVNNKIQEAALKCHKALGCRAMSRTDIILTPNIEKDVKKKRKMDFYLKSMARISPFESSGFYILETNTIPGMTPTSLLPEAARAAEYGFGQMLDYIIESS